MRVVAFAYPIPQSRRRASGGLFSASGMQPAIFSKKSIFT
jgi:hypothetical protein